MSTRYGTPFRIGTTSYIYPDDILPNARRLCGRVDDIELVLFEVPDAGNIPGSALVRELASLARDHALTYTPHLPLDINLGSVDAVVRDSSIDIAARLIERLAPLDPPAFVLHIPGPGNSCAGILDWQLRAGDSVGRLLRRVGIAPNLIAVENLDFPFHLLGGIIADHTLSACIDVGHLIIGGLDVSAHLDSYLGMARVMHLHGVRDGRDHISLRHLDPTFTAWLMKRLCDAGYGGVLTLEVFGETDFEESLAALRGALPG